MDTTKTRKYYSNDYRDALRKRIDALPDQVFQREDLTTDKSNQAQLRLNRALKVLIDEGRIIKISHGLYAKAKMHITAKGEHKPRLRAPFEAVAIEALNKLGVEWELSSAVQKFHRGESNYIPDEFTIKLKSRFRGNIRAEGRSVIFEGGVNRR